MRLTALLLATVLSIGCAEGPVAPSHASTGRKVAVRTIKNKTQQFGLEDTLASAVRDELLRDGRFPLVPENEADDVIAITLTHYLYFPIGYDVTLAPISYKLRIAADTEVLDRRTNKRLFTLENLEGSLTFPAPTLVGGSSETQAQATIWTVLS
ncbi:MAG: LPS assembly lipoprotein LptE, partial [Elusimicrobiota bacterium]